MRDFLDHKILKFLINKEKISWSKSAATLNLSALFNNYEVGYLEKKQEVPRYKGRYKIFGYFLTAFVSVLLGHSKYQKKITVTLEDKKISKNNLNIKNNNSE